MKINCFDKQSILQFWSEVAILEKSLRCVGCQVFVYMHKQHFPNYLLHVGYVLVAVFYYLDNINYMYYILCVRIVYIHREYSIVAKITVRYLLTNSTCIRHILLTNSIRHILLVRRHLTVILL